MSTEILPEAIGHLDFEPVEPCDNWDWSDCPNDATWRAVNVACCRSSWVLCDGCKSRDEQWYAEGSRLYGVPTCKDCGRPSGIPEFTRIVR